MVGDHLGKMRVFAGELPEYVPADVGHLLGMLAVFLVPDFGEKVNVVVTIPSAIAEISTVDTCS